MFWINVWRAIMAGGFLYMYSYWSEEDRGDIYLPPEQLRTCDFSDVGCP